LIKINKLTHSLLSKHLILESFDSLFKEADQSVTSSYGLITLHIVNEIKHEILPNYCFNQSTMRFVPTKLRLIKQQKRDEPPSYLVPDQWGSKAIQLAFQTIHTLFTQYIGNRHFKCMTKYLGYQGIALVMSELFDFIEKSVRRKKNV
jgi:cytoplasmic FMR1 interacting protein